MLLFNYLILLMIVTADYLLVPNKRWFMVSPMRGDVNKENSGSVNLLPVGHNPADSPALKGSRYTLNVESARVDPITQIIQPILVLLHRTYAFIHENEAALGTLYGANPKHVAKRLPAFSELTEEQQKTYNQFSKIILKKEFFVDERSSAKHEQEKFNRKIIRSLIDLDLESIPNQSIIFEKLTSAIRDMDLLHESHRPCEDKHIQEHSLARILTVYQLCTAFYRSGVSQVQYLRATAQVGMGSGGRIQACHHSLLGEIADDSYVQLKNRLAAELLKMCQTPNHVIDPVLVLLLVNRGMSGDRILKLIQDTMRAPGHLQSLLNHLWDEHFPEKMLLHHLVEAHSRCVNTLKATEEVVEAWLKDVNHSDESLRLKLGATGLSDKLIDFVIRMLSLQQSSASILDDLRNMISSSFTFSEGEKAALHHMGLTSKQISELEAECRVFVKNGKSNPLVELYMELNINPRSILDERMKLYYVNNHTLLAPVEVNEVDGKIEAELRAWVVEELKKNGNPDQQSVLATPKESTLKLIDKIVGVLNKEKSRLVVAVKRHASPSSNGTSVGMQLKYVRLQIEGALAAREIVSQVQENEKDLMVAQLILLARNVVRRTF